MTPATGTTFFKKYHNRKMGEYKQLKLYSQDSPGRELMEDLKGALENVKIQMARNFQNCGKPG